MHFPGLTVAPVALDKTDISVLACDIKYSNRLTCNLEHMAMLYQGTLLNQLG